MARLDDGKARRKAERWGRLAEWLAAAFLVARGYRILAWRYRTPLGEIDIVARKADLIAFVEVKSRRDHQAAIDAVTPATQRRIRSAGDLWLARRPDAHRLSLRYDILVVAPRSWPKHFPGAF